MTGIYEISNPGVCAPTNRPPGCVILDVSTQTRESFYNHAAMPVTPDVTLTPSPAINLDGSDMVRMSWPEDREREMAIEREMRMLMRSVDRKVTARILRDPPSLSPNPEYWKCEALRGSYKPIRVTKDRIYGFPGIPDTVNPQPTIPDVIG